MLSKRIIPCLDVRDGRLTKGVRFLENVDIGDPVEAAERYYEEGADEIVFYDIGASPSGKSIMLDVVRRVAERIFIPFSVGGGIGSVEDMRAVILAGAEKVSINTEAVNRPELIREGATVFGSQCIVLGMDVKRVNPTESIPSGYEVYIRGGRTPTGMDALTWARDAEGLGIGEICLNSIDADGTRDGFDLVITERIATAVRIPVIASGGAGEPAHLLEVLTRGRADAALVASMVHYRSHSIAQMKEYLHERGVKVRTFW